MTHDAIIVGGGPAGLSAALILGRCRRRVLLFDEGRPRNAKSHGVHGFLGLDGMPPHELRARARAQLEAYPDVTIVDARIVDAECRDDRVRVTDSAGDTADARALLLATGLVDELPDAANAERFYGKGLYTCPFCDGWEVRDRPLVAIASGEAAHELARSLGTFSDDVVVVVHGGEVPDRSPLERWGVRMIVDRVASFEGGDALEAIVLAGGERLACGAAFVEIGQRPASDLARRLGCAPSEEGRAPTAGKQESALPRVFVAGDAADDAQLAIVAAAQGARAAQEIHRRLRREET